jgi:hypothetical protein
MALPIPSSSQEIFHVENAFSTSFQQRFVPGLADRRYDTLASSKKINIMPKPPFQFWKVPDIGMDQFLVSKGTPLGTRGLGPCFAICSIGISRFGSPVLGLCHMSSCSTCRDVLQRLKAEMEHREAAVVETIKTYVVGGIGPSEESPEGTLNEESEILAIADSEKIEGVLFNQVKADDDMDSLRVVLTRDCVYVSKKDLFHVTGRDDGMSIFDDDAPMTP